MSMTREEAIALLNEQYETCKRIYDCSADQRKSYPNVPQFMEALGMALTSLRPITREQVEKAWKGGWEPGNPICPICGKDKFDGLDADIWADWMPNFCPHCGAPMTDEAVDMVMERLEALKDTDTARTAGAKMEERKL